MKVGTEACILFSTSDWRSKYWTNKQHTAVLLAKRGYKVLYVESIGLRTPNLLSGRDLSRLALRMFSGIRTLLLGPILVRNNIWCMSPIVIPFKHDNILVRNINVYLISIQLKTFLISKNVKNFFIWTYHPFVMEVIKKINYTKLIYHCVDDLSAIPGMNSISYSKEELKLLEKSDIVFTTSQSLFEYVSLYNKNAYFYSNVVDVEHFILAHKNGALPQDLNSIPEPRIGYHGVLSDYKVDFTLLLNLAIKKPNWSLILIGEEREGQKNKEIEKLKNLKNVYFLGYKKYTLLPNYLKGIQVALLPSLINKYTDGMFPMKYYEYIAAGLPIVSTPLSFIRKDFQGITCANDLDQFINAIENSIIKGKITEVESRNIIGENTWDQRLEKMLKKVECL